MSALAKLRAQHDAKVEEARVLMAKYPSDKRMPPEAAEQVDSVIAEAERISGQISALMAAQHAAGESWAGGSGSGQAEGGVRVLRNADDVRSHYAGRSAAQSATTERFDLHDFVRGVAGMQTTAAVSASLSVGTDSSGGYAVPSIVMPGILEALMPASALLQAGAGIVPLDNGAKKFTFAAVDSVPTAAWRLENGDVQESEPTFRAVTAAPKSLAFYFKVSRELLADAGNMTAALTLAIAQAFAKELDRAGLRGSGTEPEPRGILNTPGVQVVANGANGAALAGYGGFFTATAALLGVNASVPTAAIMSPRSLVKLGGLVDSTGQPLRVPGMLENVKLLATPAIPDNITTGTSNDTSELYLGDFSRVVFMMREQMSIQLLREAFATTGQIGFMCHVRADVAVTYPQALAVVKGVRP
ncbi:phage major capsid protein [Xylophilus sp. GW821-FHT01B05]